MSINVKFVLHDGSAIETSAEVGEKLTQIAYRAGVVIQQSCGGSPSCGDCVVRVDPKTEDTSIESMTHAESALLGNVFFITRERLACQTLVKNHSTFHVPDAKKLNPHKKKGR